MEKEILVITGGCSGLGLEIVKYALEKNIIVCNLARNKEKMAELNNKFTNNYLGFTGDITDANFVQNSIKQISQIGHITYLINCAEKACFKAPTKYNSEDIEKAFDGLKGMILCSTEVLKANNEQNLKIINILSSVALKGKGTEALYCASKWGERGYTESLKAAYKGTTVKVIGVYPGGMDTEFWQDNRDYVNEEKSSSFMKPKDVAHVILDNITNYKHLNVADIIIERN